MVCARRFVKLLAGLVVVSSTTFAPLSAYAYSGDGTGTPQLPYVITDCGQLQAMADDLSATYVLANNIDCADSVNGGSNFTAIGSQANPFSGTLLGNNYTINNLAIGNLGTDNDSGLFGYTQGATIQDVTLKDSRVSGQMYIGMLIGQASNTTINNVTIADSKVFVANQIAGGIVGQLSSSTLTDSAAKNIAVMGQETTGVLMYGGISDMGGAVGAAVMSSISKVSSTGSIVGNDHPADQSSDIGGLVGGVSQTQIRDSYSTVSLDGSMALGGLVGYMNITSSIQRTYAAGDVTGDGSDNVAGLVGLWQDSGEIYDSFSTGTVNSKGGQSGAVVTYGGSYSGDIVGTAFDAYRTGQSVCAFAATEPIDCTAVNIANNDPDYFFGNSTAAPLNTWDFASTWRVAAGSYPVLNLTPSAPQNIVVTSAPNSLIIRWASPASTGSMITGYRLAYKKTDSDVFSFKNDLNPASLSYTLTGLDSLTSYDLYLQAINSLGNGDAANFMSTTAAAIILPTSAYALPGGQSPIKNVTAVTVHPSVRITASSDIPEEAVSDVEPSTQRPGSESTTNESRPYYVHAKNPDSLRTNRTSRVRYFLPWFLVAIILAFVVWVYLLWRKKPSS